MTALCSTDSGHSLYLIGSPRAELRPVLVAIGLVAEGEDRCLHAVLQSEFGEDAADVGLDGLLADHQVPGDLPVALTAGDQPEYLAFTRRERLQRIRRRRPAERPGEPGQQLGAEAGGTCGGGADSGDDVLGRGRLEQVGGRAGVHGADEVLVVGGGGEHDDGRRVRRVVQCGEHGVSVQFGHVQVEQQHVRPGGGDDVYRLPAVPGFAGDLDAWFLAEQVTQSLPDDAVVVGDHHADRHGTGTRTVSAAPRPGALSITTLPPSSATRSRMWASPEPACGAAGSKPVPVSRTASSTWPSWRAMDTASRRALPCRTALVHASWVMRSRACSTGPGTVTSSRLASTVTPSRSW